jgi:hypothetical protein
MLRLGRKSKAFATAHQRHKFDCDPLGLYARHSKAHQMEELVWRDEYELGVKGLSLITKPELEQSWARHLSWGTARKPCGAPASAELLSGLARAAIKTRRRGYENSRVTEVNTAPIHGQRPNMEWSGPVHDHSGQCLSRAHSEALYGRVMPVASFIITRSRLARTGQNPSSPITRRWPIPIHRGLFSALNDHHMLFGGRELLGL